MHESTTQLIHSSAQHKRGWATCQNDSIAQAWRVEVTHFADALAALSPLVADLAHDLPADLHYRRLLSTLCGLFHCEGAVLMRLDGTAMLPLATHGFSAGPLERRFALADHPQLKALLDAQGSMQFPSDGALPSPCAGPDHGSANALGVHDCMGCALRIGPDAWGLLTLHALKADRFSSADLQLLDMFAGLVAATVTAVARIEQLLSAVAYERRKAEAYRLAPATQEALPAGHGPGNLLQPGGDFHSSSQISAQEQFIQRHRLSTATGLGAQQAHANPEELGHTGFSPRPCPLLPPGFVDEFFVPASRAAALAALSAACNSLVVDMTTPAIDSLSVSHRDQSYYFAHFENDYIPSQIRNSGKFYEAPFLNLLARLHQPDKIIVDGGANLGNHSVFFAGVMKAQVVAFEPQPHNNLLLQANRSLNQLDRLIDVRAKALGAHAARVLLHLSMENNYGTFTSLPATPVASNHEGQTMPAAAEFAAEVTTLDSELAMENDRISIIKLDIEGMELEALQGAQQILRLGKPLVAVECFNISRYQAVNDFLAPFGYFVVDSANATPTFIFLNKYNAFHIKALAAHLESVSMSKMGTKEDFKSFAYTSGNH